MVSNEFLRIEKGCLYRSNTQKKMVKIGIQHSTICLQIKAETNVIQTSDIFLLPDITNDTTVAYRSSAQPESSSTRFNS